MSSTRWRYGGERGGNVFILGRGGNPYPTTLPWPLTLPLPSYPHPIILSLTYPLTLPPTLPITLTCPIPLPSPLPYRIPLPLPSYPSVLPYSSPSRCRYRDPWQALKDTEYKGWNTRVLDATFPVSSGPEGLMEALDQICMESSEALRGGQCQVRKRVSVQLFLYNCRECRHFCVKGLV